MRADNEEDGDHQPEPHEFCTEEELRREEEEQPLAGARLDESMRSRG